ncbi:MAG: flagellar basal body L-ring protein FlgH [Planctomycetota bacterium]
MTPKTNRLLTAGSGLAALAAAGLATVPAASQSSSLFLTERPADPAVYASPFGPGPAPARAGVVNPNLQAVSLMSVPLPEPRAFAVNDLVTIIIRESTQSDMIAGLETEKSAEFDVELSAVPDVSLHQFLTSGFLNGNSLEQSLPFGLESDQSFEGDGALVRGESITGRIQAKVIDVKPNGTIALEARKYNQVDRETVTLTLTGICRAEDVTPDNTILSSQIYDLHLTKEHSGELRKATRKGLITQIVELLFNF